MKKLMKRELVVLSSEIVKGINEERKRIGEEKLKKSKEYLSLLKEVEKINKVKKEWNEGRKKLGKKVRELNEKLGFKLNDRGYGYLNFNDYMYGEDNCDLKFNIGWVSNNVIMDKLILKSLGGDINVEEIVKEMIKEFV